MDPGIEAELVERCSRGDASAWDKLFDQHYAAVQRFLFQLSSDLAWDDVEELAQEVFLTAIKNLKSFRKDSRLQTWLFRIAVNKAADWRSRRQAVKRGGGIVPLSINTATEDNDRPIDPPALELQPDAALVNAEQCALLYRGLDQLDQPCREIIELRYFGDESYDAISSVLDLNAKTVSSRLSRCLDRLEQIIRASISPEDLSKFPV
jgi:RNA polymerase sigma-70 factor, ECF subfamily